MISAESNGFSWEVLPDLKAKAAPMTSQSVTLRKM